VSRQTLTDRFINSRKPSPAGDRQDYADAIVPGLALRVTDRGHKSFVLVARYPLNPRNPTRRALGDYGELTLEQARQKAREWLQLIKQGIDPRTQEERQRAAQQRRQANSFAAVAADFLERHAKGLAKYNDCKTTIEREFVKRWGARPVTEVTMVEVSAAVRAIVARGSPYQAHNALGYVRRLFSWAIGTGEFGIEVSPVERLRPAELIGKREARDRVLSDMELRQVWQAAEGLRYPYAPLVRMLILTGQRVREVGDMRWPEVDLGKALWTIPAQRMKSDRAHEVPLAPEALTLLKSLPRFGGGDFVFTTTAGTTCVNGFSKCKSRLDRLVAELRARERAGEGAKPKEQEVLPEWVFHDLRRTMRTHLSALPVQDIVRELTIAHARPGLHKVYDLHAYQAEKRQCLELWEQRLASIRKKDCHAHRRRG
jgi:integrase